MLCCRNLPENDMTDSLLSNIVLAVKLLDEHKCFIQRNTTLDKNLRMCNLTMLKQIWAYTCKTKLAAMSHQSLKSNITMLKKINRPLTSSSNMYINIHTNKHHQLTSSGSIWFSICWTLSLEAIS